MHGAATTLNLSFPHRQSGKHKDGTNWVQQLFVCQGMPPCNHSFVAASLLRAFSSYQELQNHGDGAASSPPTPRLKSIVCEQNWITKKERPAFIKSLGNIKITVKWWKQSSCLMCLQQGDNYFNFHLSYLKVKCGNTNAFIHLFWSISTNPYQDFLKKKDWSIQKFEYVCTHSGAHTAPSTLAHRRGVPDQCPSTPSAGKSCHFPLPKSTCIFAGNAQREHCSTLHQILPSAGGQLLCSAHLQDNLHKESKQLPSKFQISIK